MVPAQPPNGMSGKSGSAVPYLTRTWSPTANLGGVDGFLRFGGFRFFFVDIVSRSRRSVSELARRTFWPIPGCGDKISWRVSSRPMFIPDAFSCTLAGK